MAFPDVTTLIDDFNRANGAVNAGAGSTIWQSTPIVPGAAITTISANQMTIAVGGAQCSSVATFGPDVDFTFDLAVDASTEYIAMYFAFTGVNTASYNGYALTLHLSSTTNWDLRKYTNGTGAILGASVSQATASGDQIGVSMRGSTLTAYRFSGGSWTPILTRTDSSFNQIGRLGFEPGGGNLRLDNIRGGTYVASTRDVLSGSSDVFSGGSDVVTGARDVFSGSSDVF